MDTKFLEKKREENRRKMETILAMPVAALRTLAESLPTERSLWQSYIPWKGMYEGVVLKFADLVFALNNHLEKSKIPEAVLKNVEAYFRRNYVKLYDEALLGEVDWEDEYDLLCRRHIALLSIKAGNLLSKMSSRHLACVFTDALNDDFRANLERPAML